MNSAHVIPPLKNGIFLTGPTASGKTSLAVALAQKIDAEIISLDSMAVYRRMNIGTAKPTIAERGGILHHLLDVVEPWEEFSLSAYLRAAHAAAEEIAARRKKVLVVGGTPLYLKGLLRGIFEGPGADESLRAELLQREIDLGSGMLHHELTAIDPVSAARLHPNDTKRLVRAIEIFRLTGCPISAMQNQFEPKVSTAESAECSTESPPLPKVWVLDWPRDVLYNRINRRVDAMMADGFLDEVRGLAEMENPLSKTACAAVGYRELFEYIAIGKVLPPTPPFYYRRTAPDETPQAVFFPFKVSLAEKTPLDAAVERIKQRTRNFAKRQLTWFRSFSEAQFVPMSEPFGSDSLAEMLALTLQD